MGLQIVWTVVEASNLALKVEFMEKSLRTFSSFKRYSPQNNFESVGDKKKGTTTRDPNPANKHAISSSGVE